MTTSNKNSQATVEEEPVYEDEINAAHGHTVDGDGLLNNYAIEPEMYVEDGGSASNLINRVTVVDIFPTEEAAKAAVSEMESKGLKTSQISIVGKDYQEPQNSMIAEMLNVEEDLSAVLTKLGISDSAILRFEEAVENGQFLVIEVGSDREASQTQHVLEDAGHSFQDI